LPSAQSGQRARFPPEFISEKTSDGRIKAGI